MPIVFSHPVKLAKGVAINITTRGSPIMIKTPPLMIKSTLIGGTRNEVLFHAPYDQSTKTFFKAFDVIESSIRFHMSQTADIIYGEEGLGLKNGKLAEAVHRAEYYSSHLYSPLNKDTFKLTWPSDQRFTIVNYNDQSSPPEFLEPGSTVVAALKVKSLIVRQGICFIHTCPTAMFVDDRTSFSDIFADEDMDLKPLKPKHRKNYRNLDCLDKLLNM